MRRLATLASALLVSVLSFAANPAVKDVDIKVVLDAQGAAHITEVWDVTVTEGTEWYLVRDNLGDIRVSGLSVTDETGQRYHDEGSWDVNRSIRQKAGRCGIVRKSGGGCEICWGVGSYGSHVFTVSYTMSNVVKSLTDYDMLHMQFVSPGLSSPPKHVKVTISADGQSLSDANTRIWGFGYNGTMTFQDGTAVAESSEKFQYQSSVIALMRFDKGMFAPTSSQNRSFSEVEDIAMEGADFREPESFLDKVIDFLMSIFALLIWLVPVLFAFIANRLKKRQIIGCKRSEIDWARDIPFDGNILEADYTLTKLGEKRKANAIASAFILDMINKGILVSSNDAKGRVEISFNGSADLSKLSQSERQLYDMMKEASGADVILQDKEFSRWSSSHKTTLITWTQGIGAEGRTELVNDGYVSGDRYTTKGQEKARGLLGFKKYLEDFTIINERKTIEVALWREYLVFAALLGIAEKVAKELKDVDPVLYQEVVTAGYDPNVIYMSRNLASAITNATYVQPNTDTKAFGGFGGGASFGGGGGFSGGGFGGGSR